MDPRLQPAAQLLLAGLSTRLAAAPPEPPAARLHEQLARLVRTDSAGSAKLFLADTRSPRERGIRTFFSVGHAVTEPICRAIRTVPNRLWHPALDQDSSLCDGAEVAELPGMIDLADLASTRIIVRRERPHPAPSCPCSTPTTACAARCSSRRPIPGSAGLAAYILTRPQCPCRLS